MIVATFRFLFGLVMASLAAALTTVLFVITPAEILALPANAGLARLETAAMLVTVAFTQSIRFAFVFAVIIAVLGALLRIKSWPYYVFAGLAISLLGLAALYAGEPAGQPTIANRYAVSAYTFAGLIGGYVYWLVAVPGRRRRIDDMDFTARRTERGDGESSAPAAPPMVEVDAAGQAPQPASELSKPAALSRPLVLEADLDDIAAGSAGQRQPGTAARTSSSAPSSPATPLVTSIEPVSLSDRPIRRPVGEIAQRFAPAGTGSAAKPQQPIPTPPQDRVGAVQPERSVAGSANGNGGSVPRTGPSSPAKGLPTTPPGKSEKS